MTTLAQDRFAHPVPALPLGLSVDVTLSTGASAATPAPVSSGVTVVRVSPDVDCWIAIGVNPVAGPGGARVWGGTTEYFAISAGEQVAGRALSVAGVLNVVEAI
jgi:hypothetical protein